MRLFLPTALAMLAFAANSVLTRLGVALAGMDPVDFALLRTASGAGVLWLLVQAGGGRPAFARARIGEAAMLALYMAGFSLAYLRLDAGLGALILFAVVQFTMFAGAVAGAERVPATRWAGALVSLTGLGWLLWPGPQAVVHPGGAALMAAAGLGWGLYSLAGRRAGDPLATTAANFVLALPMLLPLLWLRDAGTGTEAWTGAGVALAVTAGGLTSGLGYALWYRLVPVLGATRAGVAQLTVPILAILGGALLLAEPVGPRLALSAAVVLGGIALSLRPARRR